MKVLGINVKNTINCAQIEVRLLVADNITTIVSVNYNSSFDSRVLKEKLKELIEMIEEQEWRFVS